MDNHQLKYFVEVVRAGSVSKAAEDLFITRQTISTALNQLESELGYPLVERKKKGIVLSEDGKLFYDRIVEQFESFDAIMEDMREHAKQYRLPVKIALVTWVDQYIVEVFDRWKYLHPEYKVDIYLVSGEESNRMLENGEIHFAFTNMPSKKSEYYRCDVVHEEPQMIAVHVDNPLSRKEIITKEDLKGQTILATKLGYDDFVHVGTRYIPYDPIQQKNIVSNDLGYIYTLLIANKGICFAPACNPVMRELKCVKMIPATDDYSYPYFLRIANNALQSTVYDEVTVSLEKYLKKALQRG